MELECTTLHALGKNIKHYVVYLITRLGFWTVNLTKPMLPRNLMCDLGSLHRAVWEVASWTFKSSGLTGSGTATPAALSHSSRWEWSLWKCVTAGPEVTLRQRAPSHTPTIRQPVETVCKQFRWFWKRFEPRTTKGSVQELESRFYLTPLGV